MSTDIQQEEKVTQQLVSVYCLLRIQKFIRQVVWSMVQFVITFGLIVVYKRVRIQAHS